jgi:hypothetical protein
MSGKVDGLNLQPLLKQIIKHINTISMLTPPEVGLVCAALPDVSNQNKLIKKFYDERNCTFFNGKKKSSQIYLV